MAVSVVSAVLEEVSVGALIVGIVATVEVNGVAGRGGSNTCVKVTVTVG